MFKRISRADSKRLAEGMNPFMRFMFINGGWVILSLLIIGIAAPVVVLSV